MNTITTIAYVQALFANAERADLIPIGQFPDNQSCALVLNHLFFDGVCIDVSEGSEAAPSISPIPKPRPDSF